MVISRRCVAGDVRSRRRRSPEVDRTSTIAHGKGRPLELSDASVTSPEVARSRQPPLTKSPAPNRVLDSYRVARHH